MFQTAGILQEKEIQGLEAEGPGKSFKFTKVE